MPRRTLAFALIGLLFLVASPLGRADDEGAAGTEAARLHKVIASLRPLVSTLRGLPWKHDVPAEILSREALSKLLKAKIAKDYPKEDLERDTRIVRRLGLLRPDEDLLGLQVMMLEEMVAGAYDQDTKRLYLIEGFDGEAQKPTLVHELIHALDDQHHDLLKLETPFRDNDPDRMFAIRCLFEGSAEYARRIYQDEDRAAATSFYEQLVKNEALAAGQERVLKAVPAHLMIGSLLHYRMGPNFVSRAVRLSGGDYPAAMRSLFRDPPTTQEQLLHPHKWLGERRDYPRRVVWSTDLAAAIGPGWRRLDEHSVGELDLAIYLDYFLGDLGGRLNPETVAQGKYVSAMANRAARGWDAGRMLYLDGPDGHIVILGAFAFDTDQDAAEAADILGAALRKANGKDWAGAG